jgi:hypothetical protein
MRLFCVGLVLMVSPVVTCLIVGPLVILLLMMIGLACSGFGLFLAYLK